MTSLALASALEPERDPVVVVKGLVKHFPGMQQAAVNHVSAVIQAGAVTGLVGPDGAGKTTFIRLLAGLLQADKGSVAVAGFDTVLQTEKIYSLIGYMPQKFGLYEDLSVLENLQLHADLRDVASGRREARFRRLLSFTRLEPFQSRLAGKLSGGMQQKLGLACALLGDPKVLLLDEPSAGVDPLSRRDLWQMVQLLLAEGIGVVWSTSYLDEAEKCHEVLLLNEGQVLYNGPPVGILQRVEGRAWKLENIAPAQRRGLLMHLLASREVTDASIKGSALHIVAGRAHPLEPDMRECSSFLQDRMLPAPLEAKKPSGAGHCPDDRTKTPPGLEQMPEDARQGRWERASPCFEDAFIDILGGKPTGKSALGEKIEKKPFSGETVIEARALTKRFGNFTAVLNNDFHIGRGEIFGLLGPNGAGKSTTFKMMCGLLRPTSGTATIMGLDLARFSSRARGRIGYMAQKFSLYGVLNVSQNLHFFSGVYGLSGRKKREAIDLMVSLFNLEAYLPMTANTLPLGFKQRLALACSMMHWPDVLFLDEPTSGVDPVTRREFWMHITAMVEKGVTVMITTHFMDEAEYCDRISLIYRGESIITGTPDSLKERVRGVELPDPSLEDAFIALVQERDAEQKRKPNP